MSNKRAMKDVSDGPIKQQEKPPFVNKPDLRPGKWPLTHALSSRSVETEVSSHNMVVTRMEK